MRIIYKTIALIIVAFVTTSGGCNWVDFGHGDDLLSYRFIEVVNGSSESVLVRNSFNYDLKIEDFFAEDPTEYSTYPLRLNELLPGESLKDTLVIEGKNTSGTIFTYIINQSTVDRYKSEGLTPAEYDTVFRMSFRDYDAIDHKITYYGK